MIFEITGTPKNISLTVKQMAKNLIIHNEKRKGNKKSMGKFLLLDVLLRKECWDMVCGLGNINFIGQNTHRVIFHSQRVIFHSKNSSYKSYLNKPTQMAKGQSFSTQNINKWLKYFNRNEIFKQKTISFF